MCKFVINLLEIQFAFLFFVLVFINYFVLSKLLHQKSKRTLHLVDGKKYASLLKTTISGDVIIWVIIKRVTLWCITLLEGMTEICFYESGNQIFIFSVDKNLQFDEQNHFLLFILTKARPDVTRIF